MNRPVSFRVPSFGTRRSLFGALALVLMSMLIGPGATAASLPGPNYLMVADPGARKVFFYSVPDLKLTGQLADVGLGTAATPSHGGTIVLPGGRILINDEVAQKTLAVRIDIQGKPKVVNSVDAKLGSEAPWTAVDPQFRYYAVPSNDGGPTSTTEVVNLIDLKTFKNTQIEVENPTTEDVHPYLAGTPLTLFLALGGGKIQAFTVEDLLNGPPNTPTSEGTVGTPTHGHFISPKTKTLGITTGPGAGLDVISCGNTCSSLGARATVPWDVDGLTGGRSSRPRLAFDGSHVLAPIPVAVTPPDATKWDQTRQDIHVTNLKTKTAERFTVGTGATSRGFPTSFIYAAFVVVHPKGDPRGDELHLINVLPGSPNYLEIVRTVKLEQMTNGPVAGVANTYPEFERRFLAITPDGRYAFATHGGDSKVSMINTTTGSATSTSVPTSLTGGGYITAFRLGFPPFDLMGR